MVIITRLSTFISDSNPDLQQPQREPNHNNFLWPLYGSPDNRFDFAATRRGRTVARTREISLFRSYVILHLHIVCSVYSKFQFVGLVGGSVLHTMHKF